MEVFGLDIAPVAESADLLYDELSAALRRPGFRPRALFERFDIELLATTDSPLSTSRSTSRSSSPAGPAWWSPPSVPTR